MPTKAVQCNFLVASSKLSSPAFCLGNQTVKRPHRPSLRPQLPINVLSDTEILKNEDTLLLMPSSSVFPGHWDATALIVVICSSLAGYNAIELILLIFTTFNIYKGLYFWSLVVATTGLIPYIIGLTVFYFDYTSPLFGLIINNIGWIATVVGQSVVLYSRLGVVLGKSKSRILQFVKWMIIISSIIFYVLSTVTNFGKTYDSNAGWYGAYRYCEKIQMTGFCVQEFIISGLYIWKTLDIIQAGEKKHAHRTLWQLFIINVVIVTLDVGLLVIEYLNFSIPEIAFKALAYSVKLKLEFAILSKLVEVSGLTRKNLSISMNDPTILDDVRLPSSATGMDNSPTLVCSRESPWPHLEKQATNDVERAATSDDSVRSTSQHTEASDQHLFRPGLKTIRSRSCGGREADEYHDMIKVISSA